MGEQAGFSSKLHFIDGERFSCIGHAKNKLLFYMFFVQSDIEFEKIHGIM